jgi:hypothetical protein
MPAMFHLTGNRSSSHRSVSVRRRLSCTLWRLLCHLSWHLAWMPSPSRPRSRKGLSERVIAASRDQGMASR